mmetsp:Transcript_59573/g.146325  ORF Transcript_59573/g.146325 Transcript_59573/m.146325 type:complete len:107 (+) Transcript_59573:367-687(+)
MISIIKFFFFFNKIFFFLSKKKLKRIFFLKSKFFFFIKVVSFFLLPQKKRGVISGKVFSLLKKERIREHNSNVFVFSVLLINKKKERDEIFFKIFPLLYLGYFIFS